MPTGKEREVAEGLIAIQWTDITDNLVSARFFPDECCGAAIAVRFIARYRLFNVCFNAKVTREMPRTIPSRIFLLLLKNLIELATSAQFVFAFAYSLLRVFQTAFSRAGLLVGVPG